MNNLLKVALIGANGQLGSDIFSHFSAQSDRYQITSLIRSDIQSKKFGAKRRSFKPLTR